MIFILFLVKAPLDDNLISNTELGKLKLEYVIKEGLYPYKKFYLLLTVDNKMIIKAKGIDNYNNLLN